MGTGAAFRRPSGDTPAAQASGMELTPRGTRLVAGAGLESFLLIVVASFVAPPLWKAPGTNASIATIAAYAQANRVRAIAAFYLFSLAMGLFLIFAAGLWSYLRQIEHSSNPLPAVFAIGASGLGVLVLAAFATGGLMFYRSWQPAITALLGDVTFGLLALSGIPTAVCLGAYAALVIRGRSLPRWTAWLAALGAVTHVFIPASFMSHGRFLSLEGSVIVWVPATLFAWILATSASMLRASRCH